MVDDPRIAALAEALTDLFPAVQRDWWPFTSEQAAAAILAALPPDWGECPHCDVRHQWPCPTISLPQADG